MELGSQIRTLRTQRGITQEKVAQALNVSPQAVSKWECGQSTPDIQLLPVLAVYFGVTIDELFCLTDDQQLERIENMMRDRRRIPPPEFERAEQWLLERAEKGFKPAECWTGAAALYNHQADVYRQQAATLAKKAIQVDPYYPDGHRLLQISEEVVDDWCCNSHCDMIRFYQDFLKKYPDCANAYISLLDALIDSGRYQEAKEYVERFKKYNDSSRPDIYAAKVAWYAGDRDKAHWICQQMEQDFAENWLVFSSIGDLLVREQRYEEAITYYQRSLEKQKPPRFTDDCESIAWIGEITGNRTMAIEALKEALDIVKNEWGFTTGESVERIERWMARL